MSRWAKDPEEAADALIERCLNEVELQGRPLLVNQGGSLPALLVARGLGFNLWNRRVVGNLPAVPWPPPGPFDAALVRLRKARDEQEMTVHAALSVLSPGGRLILYGGNDEGIRSAARIPETLGGVVETLATRGHGRVLVARRLENLDALKSTLRAWRIATTLEIAGAKREWISYPGIFAAGRLDEGTTLLLGTIPILPRQARILDYGCGSGAIGATVLAQQPSAVLDMLDSDAVAMEAARENVPGASLVLGTRLADVGHQAYDAILSNPPLHQGVAEDHALLEGLVMDAPSHLTPGGLLQIVVQRRIPLDRLLASHFGHADIIAETGRYRVWRARKG